MVHAVSNTHGAAFVIADLTGFQIPMPATEVTALRGSLAEHLLGCLQAVPGYSRAAAELAQLVHRQYSGELCDKF